MLASEVRFALAILILRLLLILVLILLVILLLLFLSVATAPPHWEIPWPIRVAQLRGLHLFFRPLKKRRTDRISFVLLLAVSHRQV
jgi:hypothetical protein